MNKKIILLLLIVLGNLLIGAVQSFAGDKNLNDISNYLKKAGYKEAKVEGVAQLKLGEFTKIAYNGTEMVGLIDREGPVMMAILDIPSVGKTLQFLTPIYDVSIKLSENASGEEAVGYWYKIGLLLMLSSNDAVGKLMWNYDNGNVNYVGMLPTADLSEKSFTSYLNMYLATLSKYADLKDKFAEIEKKGAEGFSDAIKKEKKETLW